MKSKLYTSTELTKYIVVDFIGQMTAVMLGIYWIFKIFYMYGLPVQFNSEIETIKRVYRVNEPQDATNVNSLKGVL